jgi:hypothetical protein
MKRVKDMTLTAIPERRCDESRDMSLTAIPRGDETSQRYDPDRHSERR